MIWWEVVLCSYQPDAFIVQAGNPMDAIKKTIDWAIIEYPGMFIQTGEHSLQIKEHGFPMVSEIGDWA